MAELSNSAIQRREAPLNDLLTCALAATEGSKKIVLALSRKIFRKLVSFLVRPLQIC